MQLRCVRRGDWMVYQVPIEHFEVSRYKSCEYVFVEYLNKTNRVISKGTKVVISDDYLTMSKLVSINVVPRMAPEYLQRRRLRSQRKWAKYAAQGRRR